MIGKVIDKKKGMSSSIRRLNAYILNEDGRGNDDHKVMCAGCLNIDGGLVAATDSMEWEAAQNKRCKEPVMHCLLSWRTGEQPDEAQTREAVKIALEELGLSGQQCVWALHGNTDNFHVHISVSRIDRMTRKALRPGGGWPKKAMERAARRVEHAQNWEIEKRPWMRFDGDLAHEPQPAPIRETKIPQNVRDIENMTGEKSAMRIAKERLSDKRFSSWEELHKSLAVMNMRYDKKGSGAVIFVGDTPIKASAAGKRFALAYLEKSLGEFCPAQISASAEHISEPLDGRGDTTTWQEYADLRAKYYKSKRVLSKDFWATLRGQRADLAALQMREREAEIGGEDWRGRRDELNRKRSVLAAKHKAEKLELRDAQDAMKARFKAHYPVFPTYEHWLRREKEDDRAADLWRARDAGRAELRLSLSPDDPAPDAPTAPRDIRGFSARETANGVLFVDKADGTRSFIDKGATIKLLSNDDSTIVASLQLAVQKWGAVRINGDDEYKQRCLALAVQNGVKVANPELQDAYKRLLDERRAPSARSPQQLADFRAYHIAVGADRYRVTATQMFEDGTKRGFMVNKRDGAPDGFTAVEMETKMPRLAVLEEREGRNIYYTPVSAGKHHILIDDLTNDSLARLIIDGFEPAAILETSPGNFQAVITIPKQGTDMDREIGNELVARLNKKYGDPKVSGEIHAHRAPGFGNMKPKHRREDGTFPQVKLTKAKNVMCAKTARLAKEVRAELEARRRETAIKMDAALASLPTKGESVISTARAYELHFKDLLRMVKKEEERTGKGMDVSRIDAKVCVRLRGTGHTQEDIRAAVELMSPKMREAMGSTGTHVWPDYARRTAEYAFGHAGDRDLSRMFAKYADYWKKVETPPAPKREVELDSKKPAVKSKIVRRDEGMGM